MPQLYLFAGENGHDLREERRRWREEFTKKHGPDNMVTLDGQRLTLRQLLDEVSVMPFLASKRLVFVDPLPKLSEADWETLKQSIHPDVLLVFVDLRGEANTAGRRRPGAGKEAEESVESVKLFPLLNRRQLEQWVVATAKEQGCGIEPPAVTAILELLGDDQDLLQSEIAKLAVSAEGANITRALVEDVVIPTAEGVVWRITDLLSAGQGRESLAYAHRFLERGGEAFALWAILLSFVRNLAVVAAAVAAGETDVGAITRGYGVPFPSARGLLPYARKVSRTHLKRLVNLAAETDLALKTGTLKATDDAPQELHAAIDRLLLAIGNLG